MSKLSDQATNIFSSLLISSLDVLVGAVWSYAAPEITCSPSISSNAGSISLTFNCPVSISNKYYYSIDDDASATIAKYYNFNSVAIKNFFRQINEENVPPYEVDKRLEAIAVEVKRLRSQANNIPITEKTKEDLSNARDALENGDIDAAVLSYKSALAKALGDEQGALNTLLLIADLRQSAAELMAIKPQYSDSVSIL